MNVPNSDKWVDGLTPSGRPVPEPPPAFIAAVRHRRIRRRMGQAACATSVVLAAGLIALLVPRHAPTPVSPIAVNDLVSRVAHPIPHPEPVGFRRAVP